MLAYPTEDQKGKFIGIFWSIFNLGGVVGAAVSLGNNYDNTVRPPSLLPPPLAHLLLPILSPIPVSLAPNFIFPLYSPSLVPSPLD